MLEIEREITDVGGVVLHLRGVLSIETVAQLREELLGSLDEAKHLILDGSELENIDFFGLQLLCAAHRTSIAEKKLLTWKTQLPPQLNQLINKTGFSRSRGCSLCPDGTDCMWLCGGSER